MLFIQSNQPIVCPVDKALRLKYLHTAAADAKSLQSCPTLCDPIESSPPGSPVPGILQARTLEWVAISFSNEWKWKVKVKSLSRVWLPATPWTAAHQAPPSMDFPGKSTGVGCHCLLQSKALGKCKAETYAKFSKLKTKEKRVNSVQHCQHALAEHHIEFGGWHF